MEDQRISIPRRIQVPAYTDAWMKGDRFGDIVGQGRTPGGGVYYRVKLDKSGRTGCFVAGDCTSAD